MGAFTSGLFKPTDQNGNIYPYGRVTFLNSATLQPFPTYSNPQLTSPNPHPIVLDAKGEAWIYLDMGNVNVTFTDFQGVLVWIIDDYFNTNNSYPNNPNGLLEDLDNVQITNPTLNEVLGYNGTKWVNMENAGGNWGEIEGDITTQADLIGLLDDKAGKTTYALTDITSAEAQDDYNNG